MKIPSRAGISAGPPDERSPRRRRRAVVAALVAAGLAGSALALPGIAAAAVPTFPDNVVVFPDRDFVTIEGYQDHVGQTATIEVWRGTQIVGSAQGVVEAGDVAFEVNHPGGYCWGAGTNLKVTPDIKPGDRVSIRFGTAANADADDSTTVADAFVNADSVLDEATRTLTVTGAFNGGLNPAQVEQRIVNPELTATDVARRDVRAVPGGLVAAPKGGYSSNLEITGNTFKATYVFTTLETARIAATGGGERFMSWQVEDAEANRQGLTIAEYGELGGPGMGGCPAGPADVGAPAGTAQVIRSGDGLSASGQLDTADRRARRLPGERIQRPRHRHERDPGGAGRRAHRRRRQAGDDRQPHERQDLHLRGPLARPGRQHQQAVHDRHRGAAARRRPARRQASPSPPPAAPPPRPRSRPAW